jgi:hypothetical protein
MILESMKSTVRFLIFNFSLVYYTGFSQFELLQDSRMPGKPLQIENTPSYGGTPYLLYDWCKGEVKFFNNQKITSVQLRYNVLEDVLEFSKDGVAFALDPEKINEFRLTGPNEEYYFRNGFSIPGYSPKGYVQILFEGKVFLVKKITKVIGNDPGATYGSSLYREIQTKSYLFTMLSNSSFVSIKPTKSSIKKIFPEIFGQINDFIKSKSINLRDERDLIDLFGFINSIN